MIHTFAFYVGIMLILWSLSRIVNNNRLRKELMKKKLYEIAFDEADSVDVVLLNHYCDLLKQHGPDSRQALFARRINQENEDFIRFCDSVDSIERML